MNTARTAHRPAPINTMQLRTITNALGHASVVERQRRKTGRIALAATVSVALFALAALVAVLG